MTKRALQLITIMFLTISLTSSNLMAQQIITKVNTEIFPSPEEGYKKMIIEVPHSDKDALKRIEFSVGKYMEVDGCNSFGLSGTLEQKDLQGWGYDYYVFKTKGDIVSTEMACPDAKKRWLFVSAPSQLVRYNGKMPIIVYVPKEYTVQFKIYTANDEVFTAAQEIQKSK